MTRLRFVLCVAATLLAACQASTVPNGMLPCSSDGQCPSGYVCQSDHNCWTPGTGPAQDMGSAPDAAQPPAAPVAIWVSSGGGSATAPSGSQLNLSVGGTPIAGRAQATQSASVITFGYLSCDTY
jgi:hypothetical protein